VEKSKIKRTRIKAIKVIENADVYNLTTEKNHNYFAENVLVKNCGEQFLGAYSNCLLGHMNLSKYVTNLNSDNKPFFEFTSFKEDIKTAVRFMDNVIDYNDGKHALLQQNETAMNERRIGLGFTGLADMFVKLGVKYDSDKAIELIDLVMKEFRDAAYEASVELAEEKGAFPWFEKDEWLKSEFTKNWYDEVLAGDSELNEEGLKPSELYEKFKNTGIRNSFLLTVAPVGSGSIIAQVSSGLEPIFATSYTRRVRQPDGQKFYEYKTYPKIISELFGDDTSLPNYVVTSHDIDPFYRVKLQGVIQRYIDNSISSTINLPSDTPIDVVAKIYIDAWKEGLKSTTIYRDGCREGVLITDKKSKTAEKEDEAKKTRPITLGSKTYKIPDGPDRKLYITISGFENDPYRPFEVFIQAYGPDDAEVKAIAILVSALLRKCEDIDFLIDHLGKIDSPKQGAMWHDKEAKKKYYINSVPRAIGIALKKFISNGQDVIKEKDEASLNGAQYCPKCHAIALIKEEGCEKCLNCGAAKCF
jgi:ribonucleoside-diphosphate reductase alpha chain